MPLFRRVDGTLVSKLPPLRRVMPYIMRGRNESAVYVDTPCDVTLAKKWLWSFNRTHSGEQCTFLHLFLYAVRIVRMEFPQMDRFVSGRHIYQRKTSTISLMVKESMEREAPLYSIKFALEEGEESLGEFCSRIATVLRNARQFHERAEKETDLLLMFPDRVVRLVLYLRALLDSWNILPEFLLRDDPLYTTLFVGNNGSLSLPDAFHHLYEHGNCSAFAMISSLEKRPIADWDGNVSARDILPIRWTIDDRVADGFEAASALKRVQAILENPAKHLGSPEKAASSQTTTRGDFLPQT